MRFAKQVFCVDGAEDCFIEDGKFTWNPVQTQWPCGPGFTSPDEFIDQECVCSCPVSPPPRPPPRPPPPAPPASGSEPVVDIRVAAEVSTSGLRQRETASSEVNQTGLEHALLSVVNTSAWRGGLGRALAEHLKISAWRVIVDDLRDGNAMVVFASGAGCAANQCTSLDATECKSAAAVSGAKWTEERQNLYTTSILETQKVTAGCLYHQWLRNTRKPVSQWEATTSSAITVYETLQADTPFFYWNREDSSRKPCGNNTHGYGDDPRYDCVCKCDVTNNYAADASWYLPLRKTEASNGKTWSSVVARVRIIDADGMGNERSAGTSPRRLRPTHPSLWRDTT